MRHLLLAALLINPAEPVPEESTYERERRTMPNPEIVRLLGEFRALLGPRASSVSSADMARQGFDWSRYMVMIPLPDDTGDVLAVLATLEHHGDGGPLEAHLSCRVVTPDGGGRSPIWRELVLARALAWPDNVQVLQIMPPAGQYVNLHEQVLHLWGPRP